MPFIVVRIYHSTFQVRLRFFVTQGHDYFDYSLNMIKMIDSGSSTKEFVNFSTMSGILTIRRNKLILFSPLLASVSAEIMARVDILLLRCEISK